ncbi:hypothetical protein [Pedobacter gandavensis]|uniref:Entericidin n=1 Tax=Pedobacter gandavensis TaxID=2679963 RepID=A0ABR6ERY1_9SPHI|nr:hypothetical protein [Pedobacter gandavensis]MBB2148011.1 hypothetical protein [Pedobacter gandavensis]
MKNKLILVALGAGFLMACGSPEQHAKKEADTNAANYTDSSGMDTTGIKNSIADTTDAAERAAEPDPGTP